MTPDHASPEQVRGAGDHHFERCLCAGRAAVQTAGRDQAPSSFRPCASRKSSAPSARRTRRCPATRSATVTRPQSRGIAEARSTNARAPAAASCSGDLDNIVLMAMRKEPERRYGSAQQMASDIQRYLDGKPVIARRDTLSYRTAKFVRRHWLPVAGRRQRGVSRSWHSRPRPMCNPCASPRNATGSPSSAKRPSVNARAPKKCRASWSICSSCRIRRRTAATRSRPANCWTRAPNACRPACKISPRPRRRCCRPWARCTTASGSTRTRMPILTESLALQPHVATTNRASIRCWNWAAHASAPAICAGAEAPLQEALHVCAGQFRRRQSGIRPRTVGTGQAAVSTGPIRRSQGAVHPQPADILETTQARRPTFPRCSTIWRRCTRASSSGRLPSRPTSARWRSTGECWATIIRGWPCACNNLAIVAQNMGDLKQAESAVIARRSAATKRPTEIGIPKPAARKGNYGLLLQREGRLAEAEPLLRSALDVEAHALWARQLQSRLRPREPGDAAAR